VTLWEAGASGYGTGAIQLGTATSNADGSFIIPVTCSSASAQIYLTAQGGNAGGGGNSSLMMMAALGPCDSISIPVVVNEVTTSASVYALAQFLSTVSYGTIGAPSTNAVGLANAFATAANLANVRSGTALSATPAGAGTAPQQNLNSIANALAACDQTSGSSSSQCTELFDCALPGAVFSSSACSGGTGSVANTLAAALSIALDPAGVSVAGVYDVASKAALYSPPLASAPDDWSMPLTFSTPAGSKLAIDGAGHVWLTTYSSVIAVNNNGIPYGNFAPTGSNFNSVYGIAIDSAGHVWVTNSGGDTVTALNNDGTLYGNFAPAGSNFSEPYDMAIDSAGHVWVTNYGGNTVTALNNDGTLYGNFAPTGSYLFGVSPVAIDSSGNVWMMNSRGDSVTALNNDGALYGNFPRFSGSVLDTDSGIAIDSSGHVWVPMIYGVTALNNDGSLFGNFDPSAPNSFFEPVGVAIDGAGQVWVANYGSNNVIALNNEGTLFGSFAPSGSNLNGPWNIAIDSSGNVWVTNYYNNTLTELVGVAAPVKTPFIGPPRLP
jgi:streptogramin lyase